MSSFADATVSGFLPARFSNFVSEFTKMPAALWRVRYDSADIGEEDLELVELEDAMRAYNSDSWSGCFTGKSLKQTTKHGNSKIKKKQGSHSRTTGNQHAGEMIGKNFFGKTRVGQVVGWTSIDSASCGIGTDMEGKGSHPVNRTAVPRRKKIARLLQEATQKDSTEEKTGDCDGCWGEHERLLGESSSSRATGERVRPEVLQVQSPYVDLGLQSRSQRKDAEWLHEDQDLGTLSTEELTLLQTLSVILYAHSTMPPFH